MMAVASRSQCGAPSPENAGTSVIPPESVTPSARLIRSATRPAVSSSAAQAKVAPDDRMLPSRAYVGRSVSQARVAGTGDPPGTKASTGVITDDPVP
jgi:hypothetical protein